MNSQMRPKDVLFEQFARVGKALASPKRLELVDVLAQGERSVESLAQATSLKLTTASAHLQTLRQGGLVVSRKDGTRIFYRLAGEDVARLFAGLRAVAGTHLAEAERAAEQFLGIDEVEPISRDDLLDRVRNGRAVILDVRPESEYAAAHIAGAISIPLDQLENRLSDLPDLEIVAYCRGEYCVLSYDAVRLLRSRGRMARRMAGGMLEWTLEHRQIAIGAA
ncbi:ArsR/SmtB family transcription factor [Actinokineospora sp.]|uniref:ArsR/SmtB family transcription factor n=1 Tax=Actinokineospora sp. TaxID=1872133 RepID=UPI004037B1C6